MGVESGAYKTLCEALSSEREHVLNKYVSILADSYFIGETWTTRALSWYMRSLSDVSTSNDVLTVAETINFSQELKAELLLQHNLQKREFTLVGLTIQDGTLKKYLGKDSVGIIPDNMTEIADRAFYANEELEEVIIPSSVKTMGKSAFVYCKALQTVQIDEGVERIEDWAFINCSSLNEKPNPSAMLGRIE